ncbi:MAG: hypothetical protein ABI707_04050 [Ferruginibacter sp.]
MFLIKYINTNGINPFRQTSLVAIFFVSIFMNTSCTTIHAYQTGGPKGREQGNQPGTEWESKSTVTFLWGAMRQDVQIKNCTLGDGSRLNIEEFKIEKNFGSILVTIVTLGLVEPAKISWRCAKPKQTNHD